MGTWPRCHLWWQWIHSAYQLIGSNISGILWICALFMMQKDEIRSQAVRRRRYSVVAWRAVIHTTTSWLQAKIADNISMFVGIRCHWFSCVIFLWFPATMKILTTKFPDVRYMYMYRISSIKRPGVYFFWVGVLTRRFLETRCLLETSVYSS